MAWEAWFAISLVAWIYFTGVRDLIQARDPDTTSTVTAVVLGAGIVTAAVACVVFL